jgi:hypothetical protein
MGHQNLHCKYLSYVYLVLAETEIDLYSVLGNDLIIFIYAPDWSQGTALKHMKKDLIGQKQVSIITSLYVEDS